MNLCINSISACLFAIFIQEPLIKRIGIKATYLFGLLTFAVSMMFMVMFPTVIIVNLCAALSGFGTAVANTIPGTLVTKYHASPESFLNCQKQTIGSTQGV